MPDAPIFFPTKPGYYWATPLQGPVPNREVVEVAQIDGETKVRRFSDPAWRSGNEFMNWNGPITESD